MICGWIGGGKSDAATRCRKQVYDTDTDYGSVQRDVHVCEGHLSGCVHWKDFVMGAGWAKVGMVVWNGVFRIIELEGGLDDRMRC